jgi:RHS repeat-associated protein
MWHALRILLLACLACTPDLGRAQGTCGPVQLGAPCAQGGVAGLANSQPGLSLTVGNPIHLITGNKYQRETDLPIHPSAPDIEILRHYNALDRRSSMLGQGWALSYDTRLFHAGGRWQIVQADGSRIDFGQATDKPMTNPHGTLVRQGDLWVWSWPNRKKLHFNKHGYLVRIHNVAGTAIDIHRAAPSGPLAHAIEHIANDAGTVLRMGYRNIEGQALLSHIDTARGRFRYLHDARLRLTGVMRPDGMQRRYLYEPERQAGNAFALTGIEVVSADGRHTRRLNTWAYDAQGRAILSISAEPSGLAGKVALHYVRRPTASQGGLTVAHNAQGQETRFETALLGGRGVLTRVSGAACPGCASPGSHARYDQSGGLVQLNSTSLQRDAHGAVREIRPGVPGWPRLALRYHANGTRQSWSSSLTGTETIHYNPRGLPAQRLFANGDTISYEYDTLGRPLRLVEKNARAEQTTTLSWRGSLLSRIAHPQETESREYDQHQRLRQRTVSRPSAGPVPLRYTESFEYDPQHRLTLHKLPEGGALEYRWNGQGRLAAILWHDAHGQIHSVIDSTAGVPGYRYGNGLHLSTELNRQGQASLLALSSNGEPIWMLRHHYDERGRLSHEQHIIGDHGETLRYAYDDQSRLIGAQASLQPRPSDTNNKDKASGRHGPAWYAWNDDGSMAAKRLQGHTHKPAVQRDASGLPLLIDGHALDYGPGRRLVRVQAQGKLLASYTHNAYGHRISSRSAQADTDYFYLDNRLVAEHRRRNLATGPAVEPDGASPAFTLTRRYIYAQHVLVGMIDYTTAALYWVHSDFVGAPRLLTDSHQKMRWQASYSLTGLATRVAGDLDLDIRLPGQVFDATTGWHDNLLRSYLPQWGHYAEPDPLGPVPGNQALGYAAQQPRRYADPLGLLLFAFDGTRHSPETQSNIWKMSQAYRDGPVFYHSGPGNSLYLDWDAVTGGRAAQILENQWQSLLNTLNQAGSLHDPIPIDIIGFSRGAALARHFGNLINQHTVEGLFSYADALRGHISACVDLRFMGLFDTVAQFGPAGLLRSNFDLTVAQAWQWVAHAVALHERRWIFPLTVALDADGHNVVEAPFIGAHADIGGGALRTPDGQPRTRGDLSDVALNWMLWQAGAASVDFQPLPPSDREITSPILHDERPAVLRSAQDGDRRVDGAGGTPRHAYQDDHPLLGKDVRARSEALIARHENWRASAGSEVGTVDMTGYAQWLHDELGWRPPSA